MFPTTTIKLRLKILIRETTTEDNNSENDPELLTLINRLKFSDFDKTLEGIRHYKVNYNKFNKAVYRNCQV